MLETFLTPLMQWLGLDMVGLLLAVIAAVLIFKE